MKTLGAIALVLVIIILAPTACSTLGAMNLRVQSPFVTAPVVAPAPAIEYDPGFSRNGESTKVEMSDGGLMGVAAQAQTSSEYLMGEISVGQKGRVKAGNACSGDLDVSRDGQQWASPYRREAEPDVTGQVIKFESDGVIYASVYPGSCFPMSELTNVMTMMKADGCSGGCKLFNEVTVK